jgi:hypothetical protein
LIGFVRACKEIADQSAIASSAVGEEWWKALRKGQAGLTVKDLADTMGLLPAYIVIYGPLSDIVHAGDAIMHVDIADDKPEGWLDLTPSWEGIDRELDLASSIFLGCLAAVHNRLDFGPEAEDALNALAARLGVIPAE